MPSIGQSPDFKADLFSIVPSLLVLGPPAFLLFFTSTIHLFDTPLLLLLTATLLALLLPPHLPFAALLLRGRETKKCQKFSTTTTTKKNHNFQQSNQSHLQKCSRKKKQKTPKHPTSSSRLLCSFCCSMRFCLSASSCRLYSSCSRSCCSWRSCWRRSASDRSLFSCCKRMKSRRRVDSPGTLTMELDGGRKWDRAVRLETCLPIRRYT